MKPAKAIDADSKLVRVESSLGIPEVSPLGIRVYLVIQLLKDWFLSKKFHWITQDTLLKICLIKSPCLVRTLKP